MAPTRASTAQANGDADELSVALLPVLLHRVSNVTQLLASLRAIAELEDGPGLLAANAEHVAEAADKAASIGWLLGVLAGGSGTDVLLARRERGGLRPFLELVAEGLRRRGRDLEAKAELPELAADGAGPEGAGWQVCWTLGALLFEAALSFPEGHSLAWELAPAGSAWELRFARGRPGSAERARELAGALPGLELAEAGGACIVRIPGPWLLGNA